MDNKEWGIFRKYKCTNRIVKGKSCIKNWESNGVKRRRAKFYQYLLFPKDKVFIDWQFFFNSLTFATIPNHTSLAELLFIYMPSGCFMFIIKLFISILITSTIY